MVVDLTGLKVNLLFRVPGQPEEGEGFAQEAGNLSCTLEGARVIKAVDQLMADTAFLRQIVVAGLTLGTPGAQAMIDKAVNKKLFGKNGEVWERLKGPYR
jgi:hypothetical protein